MAHVPLSPVTGPECTRCGCRDAVILSEPFSVPAQGDAAGTVEPWTTPGRAICRHCETRFSFWAVVTESRPMYAGPRCPDCGGDETKCTHSYPPTDLPVRKRRHVCKGCGAKFTTEQVEG